MLIAEEANAIEIAYLRLELLSQDAKPKLQQLFREYLDSRLETYRKLPDMVAAQAEMLKSKTLQERIWTSAIAASRNPGSHPDPGKLLLPALNNMIDITTTRTMAFQLHPPRIIFALLFSLALICSLLAGYRMAVGECRNWLHILSFAVITVIIAFVIIDVEYPRAGLIRLQASDQVLVQLRDAIK